MSLNGWGGVASPGLLSGIDLEGERIVVGAVGMWESHSDFQGRWETRETCFWFSSFSIARHFHSPVRTFQRGVFAPAKLANSLVLACCIFVAAAVSLSTLATRSRASIVCPGLRYLAALGNFWNVSQGVW